MSEIKILGIDQATKTGWACGDNLYGEWDFKVMKDEDNGMRLLRFRAKLIEMIQSQGINLVAYERTAGQFKSDVIISAKLVAIIETVCKDHGANYTAFSAKEIKQFATGKGNASKDDMVAAAKQKYGYTGTSDNTADAIHIYHLAKSLYK